MKPDELRVIEEEIAAIRRRSEELSAQAAELRKRSASADPKATELASEPAAPTGAEIGPDGSTEGAE